MKQLKIVLVEAVSNLTHVYSRTYLPRVGIATLGAILKNKGYHCDYMENLKTGNFSSP